MPGTHGSPWSIGAILIVGGVGSGELNVNASGIVNTAGYGIGAGLTWYGVKGFYADAQVQANFYNSDLSSPSASPAVFACGIPAERNNINHRQKTDAHPQQRRHGVVEYGGGTHP